VLDLVNPSTENEVWAANLIEHLIKNQKRVKYDRLIFKKGDLGITLTRPGRWFDCVASRINDKSKRKEIWKLVDEQQYNVEKKIYPAQRVHEQLEIDINVQQDAEKAFFYRYIFQKGLGNVGYVLYDPDAKARKENAFYAVEAAVVNMIMNQFDENDIDIRCDAYGVPTADKSLDLRRYDLAGRMRSLNSPKNYEAYEKFIDEAKKNSPALITRAYVNKAFRDRTIVIDGLFCRYEAGGELICEVPANHISDYHKYVADWLMMNDDARTIFLGQVGG
jgi:hypothetical protein